MKKRNDIYRKIYIDHYGPIPTDDDGRSYDIHHIDGDPDNNDPKNLKAVSIQEHYDIHHSQGDYGACLAIKRRLDLSPEEISELVTAHNKKRWAELGHDHPAYQNNRERLENGTHNWLGPEMNQQRIDDGTHNWVQYWTCSFCGKSGRNQSLFVRWGHDTGNCLKPRDFIPSCADMTVYDWRKLATGEIVSMTRTEFARTHGVRYQSLYDLITKRRKSAQGWALGSV